jgi:hypothetical protein
MSNSVFSLNRLYAMLAKEFIQMRRDRITFAMMLGVPLMQLILFGFAINTDPKGLPAALVTSSADHYVRAMVTAMELTGYYRFDHVGISADEAEKLLANGTVSFVVTIPSDFASRVDRGDHRGRCNRSVCGVRCHFHIVHRGIAGAAARTGAGSASRCYGPKRARGRGAQAL